MPIKSKAQRRKFAELLIEGKITPEAFERWNREAGAADLPEHVSDKPGGKANAPAKRSRPAKTVRARAWHVRPRKAREAAPS